MTPAEKLVVAGKVVVAILCLVGVAGFGIAMQAVSWEMLRQVNERLPERQRRFSSWDHLSAGLNLFREYARLFPGGPLIRRRVRRGMGFCFCMGLFTIALFGGRVDVPFQVFWWVVAPALLLLQTWFILRGR